MPTHHVDAAKALRQHHGRQRNHLACTGVDPSPARPRRHCGT
eukprot:CAMPEP_0179327162 /NCGR_PEP_ID=MMETSP0797-20121207/61813_1 /TAXON_ID=47934 /ORGANISM="Dinophysis acuminata, Strain DAEP01" /LENGTH=41 /DNA_ID= /DNA_START= /DNA_END= /DNA_ORIENTATION=